VGPIADLHPPPNNRWLQRGRDPRHDQIHTPHFKDSLRLRTQNNPDPKAPWVVVQHVIGHLLLYFYAVESLLSAWRTWPQLFDDFEVPWGEVQAILIPMANMDITDGTFRSHIIGPMRSACSPELGWVMRMQMSAEV
jgi:hypothetical protein